MSSISVTPTQKGRVLPIGGHSPTTGSSSLHLHPCPAIDGSFSVFDQTKNILGTPARWSQTDSQTIVSAPASRGRRMNFVTRQKSGLELGRDYPSPIVDHKSARERFLKTAKAHLQPLNPLEALAMTPQLRSGLQEVDTALSTPLYEPLSDSLGLVGLIRRQTIPSAGMKPAPTDSSTRSRPPGQRRAALRE
jgi:hypothetical protein